jgi:hypothetical protein
MAGQQLHLRAADHAGQVPGGAAGGVWRDLEGRTETP